MNISRIRFRDFPTRKIWRAMMREIGFSDVEYKNLTGGIAAFISAYEN